jgi:hypothetical protein
MVGPLRILDWGWIAIGLTWAAMVAVEMLGRQRAGAVLLDIGYNPRREMQLGAGVLMLLGGCYMALSSSRFRIQGLAWVAWGMAQLVTATHRLQLRQAGIFGRRKLIRWEDIAGYYIDPKGGLVLKLRPPNQERSGRIGRVDYVQRQEVSDLLASKVPAGAGPKNPE